MADTLTQEMIDEGMEMSWQSQTMDVWLDLHTGEGRLRRWER